MTNQVIFSYPKGARSATEGFHCNNNIITVILLIRMPYDIATCSNYLVILSPIHS